MKIKKPKTPILAQFLTRPPYYIGIVSLVFLGLAKPLRAGTIPFVTESEIVNETQSSEVLGDYEVSFVRPGGNPKEDESLSPIQNPTRDQFNVWMDYIERAMKTTGFIDVQSDEVMDVTGLPCDRPSYDQAGWFPTRGAHYAVVQGSCPPPPNRRCRPEFLAILNVTGKGEPRKMVYLIPGRDCRNAWSKNHRLIRVEYLTNVDDDAAHEIVLSEQRYDRENEIILDPRGGRRFRVQYLLNKKLNVRNEDPLAQ